MFSKLLFCLRGLKKGSPALPCSLTSVPSSSVACLTPFSSQSVTNHPASPLPYLQPSSTSALDVRALTPGSQGHSPVVPAPLLPLTSLHPHQTSFNSSRALYSSYPPHLHMCCSFQLELFFFFSLLPYPTPICKLQPTQTFLEGCMTQAFTPFPWILPHNPIAAWTPLL